MNVKKFILQYHTTFSYVYQQLIFRAFEIKKEEVEIFVLDNDIGRAMSHLQLGIKNNEFLSYRYTAFRRDRTDQWREVLLIVNNKFICQQIRISERLELVAITIQTCKSALNVAASFRPLKYSKEQLDISIKTTSVQFGLVMTSTCQISIEKQGL